MKKLFLALAILAALLPVADARMTTVVVGGGVASGVTCDSCTGGLILAHHFENVDCTIGAPCGCTTNGTASITLGTDASIASTTGTGWPSDGTYSLAAGSTDTTIPVSADKTQGTVTFDVYCSTFGASVRILTIGANNDGTWVILQGSDSHDQVTVMHRSDYGAIEQTNTDWDMFDGSKKTITVKWDTETAHSGHYLAIGVGESFYYADNDLVPAAAAYNQIYVINQNSSVCYIDNLKVYNTWQ